jgi:hypothetical protein
MNSTPAASSAVRMAALFGAVMPVSQSLSSARRIVATPTDEAFAKSWADHPIKARAARICLPYMIFLISHNIIVDTVILCDIFYIT